VDGEEGLSGEEEESSDEEEVDLGINDATHDKGKERESVGSSEEGEGGNYTWKGGEDGPGGHSRQSVDSSATGATGATGATSKSSKSTSSKNPITQYKDYRSRSRDLHRKHRGLMQW
jgi:hypothetical protein